LVQEPFRNSLTCMTPSLWEDIRKVRYFVDNNPTPFLCTAGFSSIELCSLELELLLCSGVFIFIVCPPDTRNHRFEKQLTFQVYGFYRF